MTSGGEVQGYISGKRWDGGRESGEGMEEGRRTATEERKEAKEKKEEGAER